MNFTVFPSLCNLNTSWTIAYCNGWGYTEHKQAVKRRGGGGGGGVGPLDSIVDVLFALHNIS